MNARWHYAVPRVHGCLSLAPCTHNKQHPFRASDRMDATGRGNASTKTRAPASDMSLPGDRREAKYEQAMRLLREYKNDVDMELSEAIAHRLNHPGHGAVDFDQPILSLGQLEEEIEIAMNGSVFEWMKRAGDGIPQFVLPQLFKECRGKVEARYQVVKSFLFPPGGKVNKTMMREHMCNNHKVLFQLVRGEERGVVVQDILDKTSNHLLSHFSFTNDEIKVIRGDISSLEMVVIKYLKIISNVYLQDPPATFMNDCGDQQEFDRKRHSKPVGGEGIRTKQLCTVAFPAMIVDKTPRTLGYTLSARSHQYGEVAKPTPCETMGGIYNLSTLWRWLGKRCQPQIVIVLLRAQSCNKPAIRGSYVQAPYNMVFNVVFSIRLVRSTSIIL
ncbi:unnamed protein product [Pylaiella littoralis]